MNLCKAFVVGLEKYQKAFILASEHVSGLLRSVQTQW